MSEEPALLADGFEEAFLGYSFPWQTDRNPVAVYDRDKCILVLMQRDGMSEEEAEEFFQYNVEGAFVGKTTPIFMNLSSIEEFNDVVDQLG